MADRLKSLISLFRMDLYEASNVKEVFLSTGKLPGVTGAVSAVSSSSAAGNPRQARLFNHVAHNIVGCPCFQQTCKGIIIQEILCEIINIKDPLPET